MISRNLPESDRLLFRTKLDAENDADCTLGLDLEQFHVLMHQAATLVSRNRDLEEDARVVADVRVVRPTKKPKHRRRSNWSMR